MRPVRPIARPLTLREQSFSGTSNDRAGRRDGADRSSAGPSRTDTNGIRSRPNGSSRPSHSWVLQPRPRRSPRWRQTWQIFASCSPRRVQRRSICLHQPVGRVELDQRRRKPCRCPAHRSFDIGGRGFRVEERPGYPIARPNEGARLERVKRSDSNFAVELPSGYQQQDISNLEE